LFFLCIIIPVSEYSILFLDLTAPNEIHPERFDKDFKLLSGCRNECLALDISMEIFDRDIDLDFFFSTGSYKKYRGIIVFYNFTRPETDRILIKLEKFIPMVYLLNPPPGNKGNFIGSDDLAGINDLFAHLLSRGFTRIGFFSVAMAGWAKDRFLAYKKLIGRYRLLLKQEWVCGFDLKTDKYRLECPGIVPARCLDAHNQIKDEYIELYFAQYFQPDFMPEAVMFANDYLANLFIGYAKKNNIKIPDDIAVTGFDGKTLAGQDRNFLTGIRQDFPHIGAMAVRMLHEIFTSARSSTGNRILCRGEFRPGRSTASVAGKRNHLPRLEKKSESFKNSVLAFLSECHDHKHVQNNIAGALGLNPEYFLTKFKKIFKTGFIEYLNNYRVARAEFLLKNTKKKITEILYETGFETSQHFNKEFKKRHQCTPRDYRKQLKNHKN